jgi:hypothetical protein
MHARNLRRGALALAVLLAPAALQAQGTQSADDVALRGYTLTMANMEKLRQTMLNLKSYMMAHQDDTTSMEPEGDDSNVTLAEQIRRVDAISPLKHAILEAGFTPRDYVMTSMTYMQAAMQAAVAKTLHGKPMKIPSNMNPANVDFMTIHQAEIAKLQLDKVMNGEGTEP